MGKQNLYEHSIRVPLIITGPGLPKNERRIEPVYIADIYPTILEYLGINTPSTCSTISLTPTFERETKIRENLFLRYRNDIAGLKEDAFKLIKYMLPEGTRISLFNLLEDPLEMTDLSENPEYSKTTKDMLLKIDEHWETLDI
jgi:arylsulfatase A-like enzyme